MKRWQGWVAGLVAVDAAVLLYGLISAAAIRPTAWPPISDPAALRREAEVLCRGEGGWRELNPVQYPPAMMRLHPASISVSGERVYIGLVPVAGGERFHGYYVWPTGTDRPDGGIAREESGGNQIQVGMPLRGTP